MSGGPGRPRVVATLVLATVATAICVVACAPLPTRSLVASRDEVVAARDHPAPLPSTSGFAPPNATSAQRSDTLERIWRTIDDVYYDPTFAGIDVAALRARSFDDLAGVHNDAEFYRVLKRDLRALHDSHTGIVTPREAEDFRTRRATEIGLVFAISEGRAVVAGVVPGSSADLAGIREGMIIDAIDGQSIDDAFFAAARDAPSSLLPEPSGNEPSELDGADLERSTRLRAVRALLVATDELPHPHRITMRLADDTLLPVTVEARGGDVPARETYTLRPSGIGVLRFSRFDSAIRPQLARDIEAARLHSHGLIIDLRSNPGGEERLFEWLVGHFVARRTHLMDSIERSGGTLHPGQTIGSVDADPPAGTAQPYLKPIALLIDRATASAAELTAHALVEQRDAIAVGEATCGCVVAIRRDFVLPDGGALRVSQVGYRTARGRRMEHDPLRPAIAVVPTLAERRAGDDVVLRAAELALLTH